MNATKKMFDFSGRSIAITGGTGHIGFEIAKAVASLGADVLIVDRQSKEGDQRVEELRSFSSTKIFSVHCDLNNLESSGVVAEAIREEFSGRLSTLINCAAVCGTDMLGGWSAPFQDQLTEHWQQTLNVNLTAPFHLAKMCQSFLEASDHGSIINVSSIYGIVGPDMSIYQDTTMGNSAAYAASKGGLTQLTKWLSTVLAPKIRVNTLTPGGIERGQIESFVKNYSKKTPLQRMGNEVDMVGPAIFLASDMSSYVTGQNIVVDGGWTAL